MRNTTTAMAKIFWDIPVATIPFLCLLIVPENNLSEDFRSTLFLIGTMVMAVSLSFQGFHRLSRFALSRDHPVLDYAMNVAVVVLPLLAAYLSPLFLPLVITLHVISHWRSPDSKGAHMHLIHHGLQFMVFLLGFVLYLNA